MWESITTTVNSHWNYYINGLNSQWQHMTPTKYGMLLVFIFVCGWVLLKSNLRR